MKKLTLFWVFASVLAGISVTNLSYAHGGYYYHGYGGPRVVVGVGPYWGPDPYYYGPRPYYGPPPVVYVAPPEPQVYVQKSAQIYACVILTLTSVQNLGLERMAQLQFEQEYCSR